MPYLLLMLLGEEKWKIRYINNRLVLLSAKQTYILYILMLDISQLVLLVQKALQWLY